MPVTSLRPWWRNPLVWVTFAAFMVRVVMIIWQRSYAVFPDLPFIFGKENGSIARSIVAGHGFSSPFSIPTGPTAWIAPVYPSLCAVVFKLFGTNTTASRLCMLLQDSAFSALTCIPIYHLGRRTVGARAGLWSAWAWALLPHFGKWATTMVWETSLSALLVALMAMQAMRVVEAAAAEPTQGSPSGSTGQTPPRPSNPNAWVVWGAVAGLASLTNPALITFVPVCVLWFWLEIKSRRRFWQGATVAALIFAALVGPWLVRNRIVFGQWAFIRDNYGFEFHLGNFHNSTGMGWHGLHPTQNDRELQKYRTMGELAYIADARRQALDFVEEYPAEFASLCWKRFAAFWDGTAMLYSPSPEPWTVATFYGFSLLALFGMISVTVRRMPGALLFWWIPLYGIPYYLSYPHPRYRHAVEPLMLLLAVFFVLEAVNAAIAWGHHRRAREST